MKKFITLISAICILNVIVVPCFAISRHASTEEKIEYIKKQSIKMRTKRMESTWEKLCETDVQTCKEKQEWFDKLLYDTKVRKQDMQTIIYNLMPLYK